MACVPLESKTFTVGPREYLTQFLNLISTLRGGDSRYLPLLLAKIHEALPAMAAPIAHSLPLRPANQDNYDSSASSDSTPYGSPPVPLTTGLDYPDLTNSMSHVGITTGVSFACITTVAATPPFYQTIDANRYGG